MKCMIGAFLVFSFLGVNAQFTQIDINRINCKPKLETGDGGYITGFEIIYLTITDAWYNEKYDIYKISGYVQNAYNIERNDTFDIDIYDSTNAIKLRSNVISYDTISAQRHSITERFGMFTIYLKEEEIAEINAPFLAYPTRITVLK